MLCPLNKYNKLIFSFLLFTTEIHRFVVTVKGHHRSCNRYHDIYQSFITAGQLLLASKRGSGIPLWSFALRQQQFKQRQQNVTKTSKIIADKKSTN